VLVLVSEGGDATGEESRREVRVESVGREEDFDKVNSFRSDEREGEM
jgi:hypothetical protein